jgi:hypothetical protein
MIRTVIDLDKAWLERTARRERISIALLVRRAIRRLHDERKDQGVKFERLLRETSGLSTAGDGLAYQRRMRRSRR